MTNSLQMISWVRFSSLCIMECIFAWTLLCKYYISPFLKLLKWLVVGKIFTQVLVQQRPILALVYLFYTKTEHNRKTK